MIMKHKRNNCLRRRSTQLLLIGLSLLLCAGLYIFYPVEVDADVASVATQTASVDKYTQSQAHMSLPEIKSLIAKTYNTKPYKNIIAAALAKEETYKNDYYVFYHGTDNVWRLAQDVYT